MTITGLLYSGSKPVGWIKNAHHISPRWITMSRSRHFLFALEGFWNLLMSPPPRKSHLTLQLYDSSGDVEDSRLKLW